MLTKAHLTFRGGLSTALLLHSVLCHQAIDGYLAYTPSGLTPIDSATDRGPVFEVWSKCGSWDRVALVERMLRFPPDFHTLILLVDATVCLVGFSMGFGALVECVVVWFL